MRYGSPLYGGSSRERKRRSARVRGLGSRRGGRIRSRRSVKPRILPERSVVARSEIRPCGGSGVGACAALLLLLLQGSPHACGLVPASRGSFFRRHRGLLSVSRRFPVVWTTTTGTTRSERERPGRPAIRAYPALAPAVTVPPHPLAFSWVHGEHRLDFHLLKPERACPSRPAFRLSSRPRPPGDSPGGRSVEAGRGRPVSPSTWIRT